MSRTSEQEKTCDASGRFASSDPLVDLLYRLMRDHLPTGVVAEVVRDAAATVGKPCEYTNGWLAQYAHHLSAMLRTPAAQETAVAEPKARGQGYAQGLLSRVLDESMVDAARYRVLLAAMTAATRETLDAPPETFNRAALQLFWDAVRSLPKSLPEIVLMALPHAASDPGWSESTCGCENPECGGCYPP